jgi:hypothetical protein
MATESEFPLALKSTIDYLGTSIAARIGPDIDFVDLDDITSVEEVFASLKPTVVWELSMLTPEPRDPLYFGNFSIGMRTSEDAANYTSFNHLGMVTDTFEIGSSHDIKNYSEDVEGLLAGRMFIVSAGLGAQAFDRTSGIRMVTVSFRASRLIG